MTRRAGFTLVELVVVILILGILAGVAAPKMFNTSGKATDNGLRQTLAIVRDAIEMYAANNAGKVPPTIGANGVTLKAALAPYIRGTFPKSPVGPGTGQNDSIAAGTSGTATPTTGWLYDTSTGGFISAYNGLSNDGVTTYDTF